MAIAPTIVLSALMTMAIALTIVVIALMIMASGLINCGHCSYDHGQCCRDRGQYSYDWLCIVLMALSSTVTTGQRSFAFEPVDTDLGDNIISEPVVVM